MSVKSLLMWTAPLNVSFLAIAGALMAWSLRDRTPVLPALCRFFILLAGWNLGIALKATELNSDVVMQLAFYPLILLPAAGLEVAFLLSDGRQSSRQRLIIRSVYYLSFVLCVLQTHGLLFERNLHWNWGLFGSAGPVLPALMVLVGAALTLGVGTALRSAHATKDSNTRLNCTLFSIGATVLVGLSTTNFLANYGFEIYPLGAIGSGLVLGLAAYGSVRTQPSILANEFLGIGSSAARAAAVASPLLLVLLASLLIVPLAHLSLSLAGAAVFLVALYYRSQHFQLTLERSFEHVYLPGSLRRRRSLMLGVSKIGALTELRLIARQVGDVVTKGFDPSSILVAVQDVSAGTYRPIVNVNAPLPSSIAIGPYIDEATPAVEHSLDEHPAPLAVPFGVEGSVQGRIVVGPRVSGVAYDEADRALLGVVASQVGLALDNLALREQLATQQGELDEFRRQAADEVEAVRAEIRVNPRFARIIGESTPLIRALQEVERAAECDLPVLVYGETGTGKELIARSIHDLSPRRNHELECVNCPAIPLELAESELFGFERGAFTGAQDGRAGSFERADQGTLFLDEVADLPLGVQTKLLRVLQEHESRRLGSQRARSLDFRLVAATNRDLRVEVAEGRFREDLMHRLMGFQIVVPPLRDRRDDIPMLASYFIARACESSHKDVEGLSTDALEILVHYPWPGNVRELKHVIERAVLVCPKRIIHAVHIGPLGELQRPEIELSGSLTNNLRDAKIRCVEETLELTNGNQAAAARILGMSRSNLSRLMKRHGIKAKRKRASRNDAATGSAD